jgi:hypothetical protein
MDEPAFDIPHWPRRVASVRVGAQVDFDEADHFCGSVSGRVSGRSLGDEVHERKRIGRSLVELFEMIFERPIRPQQRAHLSDRNPI